MLLENAEALADRRSLHEALAMFDSAEAANEDLARCQAGRWQTYMLLGQYERAWRESDAIRASGIPDPHRFWKGEGLAGRHVILRCLHGLGDAVQFLRYAALLASQAARLIVQVPSALLELASYFEGVSNVITWSSPESPEPAWDVQIEINELPYIFRTALQDLPIAVNYLKLPAPTLSSSSMARRKNGKLRVGIVWSCGAWDRTRDVPFHLLRSLFDTTGCEFWNLQGGTARYACNPHPAVHPAEECNDNLFHLATLITQLDLVITPDTLAAHLAGAVGVPALILLQHAADWRWLHERSDSPWYPNVRLFRQPSSGDWNSVIEEVQFALVHHAQRDLVA